MNIMHELSKFLVLKMQESFFVLQSGNEMSRNHAIYVFTQIPFSKKLHITYRILHTYYILHITNYILYIYLNNWFNIENIVFAVFFSISSLHFTFR